MFCGFPIKVFSRVVPLALYLLLIYSFHLIGQDNSRPIVNQAGYNLYEAKRFVCYGASDGLNFEICLAKDSVKPNAKPLHTGKIRHYSGDFTGFNPISTEEYVVKVKGHGYSHPFWIADHLMEGLSSQLAYQFFIDVRGSENPVYSNESKVAGGGPTRDCGAYALETLFEILLYSSNPALFDGWFSDFNDPEMPDLIKLILWHAEFAYHHRDYNGPTGHRPYLVGHPGDEMQTYDYQNTLDHLAAACAAYHSFLKPYLDEDVYKRYRSVCLQYWEKFERHHQVRYFIKSNKWVDIGWQEFSEMGNVLGQAIFRNLYMYLCEKNEADGQPGKFLTYAKQAAEDVIRNWDLNNPRHTWWIRNGEHITPQALAYFLLVAPDEAPFGTVEKLEEWASHMKQKTDNFWHYRKHSEIEWAHPKTKELGNTGLGGSMFLIAHLINDPQLRAIGWSQVNQVFGMNPAEAHYSHKDPLRVEKKGYWKGIEKGWPTRDPNGAGRLRAVRGTLEGTPLNSAFPYKSGNSDHDDIDFPETLHWYATEGWGISNRSWMSTVVFSTLGSHDLKVFDTETSIEVATPKQGDIIRIELKAALNLDWGKRDAGWVNLQIDDKESLKIEVVETDVNSGLFTTEWSLDHPAQSKVRVSYGYMGFEKEVEFLITE